MSCVNSGKAQIGHSEQSPKPSLAETMPELKLNHIKSSQIESQRNKTKHNKHIHPLPPRAGFDLCRLAVGLSDSDCHLATDPNEYVADHGDAAACRSLCLMSITRHVDGSRDEQA